MRTTSWGLLDLAPDGVYPAPYIAIETGGLLHHRFTLIPKRVRDGLLSAALSIPLRGPSIRRHAVLQCSDFPLAISLNAD